MLKKVITDKAQQDIRDISSYTLEHFGSAQARKYVKELRLKIEQLRLYPGIGVDRSEEFGLNVHSYFVGSHTLYYNFDSKCVTIITILHQSKLPKGHVQLPQK